MRIFDVFKKSRRDINRENQSHRRLENKKKNSDEFAGMFGLGASSNSRRETFSEFGDI